MNMIKFLKRIRTFFNAPVIEAIIPSSDTNLNENLQQTQIILMNQYRQMLHSGAKLPSFDEVGFSVYSDADEDGILHFIFSIVGTLNKKLVDIGAATISGSNTANLLINNGWTGLLIEGNEDSYNATKEFYSSCQSTSIYPPKILHQWVTAENINALIKDGGFDGDIDLLCIDIDGIDYWAWKAIDCIRPRVVLVEYQCIWGPEVSVTVPYNSDFKAEYSGRYGIYNSASLSAFVKLAEDKGYRLVGSHRYGFNAFFIRNDIGQDILPEINPNECFRHPFTDWANETFLSKIKDFDWVEVSRNQGKS